MPNWVSNTLEIIGPSDQLHKLVYELGREIKPYLRGSDYRQEQFDFFNIIAPYK